MCRRVTPKTQVLNAIEKLTWTSMNVCADACVKCETWPELENECHQILCAFPITMRCEDISTGNGNRHARLDAPLFAIQHFDLIRGTVKMTRLSDVRWLWCYDHSYIHMYVWFCRMHTIGLTTVLQYCSSSFKLPVPLLNQSTVYQHCILDASVRSPEWECGVKWRFWSLEHQAAAPWCPSIWSDTGPLQAYLRVIKPRHTENESVVCKLIVITCRSHV